MSMANLQGRGLKSFGWRWSQAAAARRMRQICGGDGGAVEVEIELGQLKHALERWTCTSSSASPIALGPQERTYVLAPVSILLDGRRTEVNGGAARFKAPVADLPPAPLGRRLCVVRRSMPLLPARMSGVAEEQTHGRRVGRRERKTNGGAQWRLRGFFFLHKESPEGPGSISLIQSGGLTNCYKGPHKITNNI
jgi:hypothetical protein